MSERGSADRQPGGRRRLHNSMRTVSPAPTTSRQTATQEAQPDQQPSTSTQPNDPTLGAGRLTINERDALLDYYYDVDRPYALTSSARHLYTALRRRVPSLTMDKCRFFLQSQSPYTLTAPHRRPEPSNPMEVHRCYDLLACDIMVLRQFADSQDTIRYCLLVVDSFSHYCWDLYLEQRSVPEVLPKFDRLLDSMQDRLLSTIIYFDQEGAIKSKAFRDMLRRHGVMLQLSYTKTKVSVAERLIRTLKKSLFLHVCIIFYK